MKNPHRGGFLVTNKLFSKESETELIKIDFKYIELIRHTVAKAFTLADQLNVVKQ